MRNSLRDNYALFCHCETFAKRQSNLFCFFVDCHDFADAKSRNDESSVDCHENPVDLQGLQANLTMVGNFLRFGLFPPPKNI